jgi:hypothetical protein
MHNRSAEHDQHCSIYPQYDVSYNAGPLHTPNVKNKGKTIPETGHGGTQGCETLRLPHFL